MMEYLWIALIGLTAQFKGKGAIRWMFVAYFFSWAAIIVLFLPVNKEKQAMREERFKDMAEEFIIQKEFRDINTVDDLINQVKKK